MGSLKKAFNTFWDTVTVIPSFGLASSANLWGGESAYGKTFDYFDRVDDGGSDKKEDSGSGAIGSSLVEDEDDGNGDSEVTTQDNVGGLGSGEDTTAHDNAVKRGSLVAQGGNVFGSGSGSFGFTSKLGG